MIYEFVCNDCSIIYEICLHMHDDIPEAIYCDTCNQKSFRIYSSPEIVFKGTWFGPAAKHGDNYRKSWEAREQDDAKNDYINTSEKEAEEIMKVRRQGKKASTEHKRHNLEKWKRYSKNLKQGIGRKA